jgi:uncharacterized protein (DUF1697 family)
MASVVFLRGANVGGKNVFRPARLAASLSHLDAVNVGAAGTFVIRGKASAATIRHELAQRLPFECHVAIRPAKDIVALLRDDPFAGVKFSRGLRGWVAVLGGKPKIFPTLPLMFPQGQRWSVRFDRIEGQVAIGLWQPPKSGGFVFPSNAVEEVLGVPATTRFWETFGRIAAVLESSDGTGVDKNERRSQ